jgi:hypothetical protein
MWRSSALTSGATVSRHAALVNKGKIVWAELCRDGHRRQQMCETQDWPTTEPFLDLQLWQWRLGREILSYFRIFNCVLIILLAIICLYSQSPQGSAVSSFVDRNDITGSCVILRGISNHLLRIKHKSLHNSSAASLLLALKTYYPLRYFLSLSSRTRGGRSARSHSCHDSHCCGYL